MLDYCDPMPTQQKISASRIDVLLGRIMLDAKTDIFLDDGEKLKRTFGKKKNRMEEEDSELAGVE